MTTGPLVLAIESATGSVGCAVGDRAGVRAEASSSEDRRHAESLAPQIRSVLAEAGVGLRDLDAVAVDIGPGLYTGLRVGITTALALATSLDLAMVGLGSLEVLAAGVRGEDRPIHAVIDARRGEVFHAEFAVRNGVIEPRTAPAVADPVELARSLAGGVPIVLVGDGVAAHSEAFAGCEAFVVHTDPRPGDALALAVEALTDGRAVSPADIRPCYLREPDAVAKWGAR